MQEKQTYSLIWFRNDLRIRDNESLAKALAKKLPIIGVYCFDERQFLKDNFGFKRTQKFRAKFLIESVYCLQEQLAQYNIPLYIYYGNTAVKLSELAKQFNIEALFFQEEWTRDEVNIERNVCKVLPHVTVIKSYSQFLVAPEAIFAIVKNIPNSFSSFRKKVEKYITIRPEFDIDLSVINQRKVIPIQEAEKVSLQTLGFTEFKNDKRTAFPFKGGEVSGLNRLEDYLFGTQKVLYYKQTRNGLVGVNYSTKFSSWLANGSLSAVTIYHQIKAFEKSFGANQSTYWVIFELLWRDFFKFIALKYKDAIFFEGGIHQQQTNWLVNHDIIDRWINGQTQCDFVNANMIELQQTGWMSNRGRQNVASYFTKELYQDWRIGAAYFESMLIDYDVHANYGNWMYVAGVGNDAKDRKFNTQLQAQKYDTNKKFRKRWLQPQLF